MKSTKKQFLQKWHQWILPLNADFDPWQLSVHLVTMYVIIGTLWVVVSDKLVANHIQNVHMITFLSVLKGWLYVILTGLGSFVLIYKALRYVKNVQQDAIRAYEDLALTHEQVNRVNQELKDSKDDLRYLAFHDNLTGLPNRLALYENLPRSVSDYCSLSGGAMLFIDMDHFKYINDTLGHSFGDKLICKAGDRIAEIIKDRGTLFRLGGDEFVVLVNDIASGAEVEQYASEILDGFNHSFEIEKNAINVSVSIGIATYINNCPEADVVLKQTDIAMYKAKELGRKRIVFYDESMNEAISHQAEITKHLHTALQNEEFQIYFQPQIDLQSEVITGFEALIRWQNSKLGFITPDRFIDVAEATHMIIPIGDWVLDNACRFIKDLNQKGYQNLKVSVNVSVLQLLQNDFVNKVLKAILDHDIRYDQLELEITESMMMESYDEIYKKLEFLRQQGVGIALDDFGKGYSSLTYLRQLPITTLKIDKTFIDAILLKERDKALTCQIISLGKIMGLTVVAEGVETGEQKEFLRICQCDQMQGYLFSKPVTVEKVTELLSKPQFVA